MLSIGNKTFMNLQEAVGWLLENNALPFQSTANYAGGVEIAMSTLINPSPAKVRVGSIIFFADSKVSTVVGVTSNSFIVSDQYNDLVDDVVYVSNVELDVSGHLIVTLSNGDTIDAGLIKQVSNFSIDGSQHLIVTFNDGTSTDLGAIFSGNITISGDLTVTGSISGKEIAEVMTGYSFNKVSNSAITYKYASACKNGNKLTLVLVCEYAPTAVVYTGTAVHLGTFKIPASIGAKIIPNLTSTRIGPNVLQLANSSSSAKDEMSYIEKYSNNDLYIFLSVRADVPVATYNFRWECTLLLGENLAE